MGQQQRLEEQHHGAQESHHRWLEQDRPDTGAGGVRGTAGHRRQLDRRKHEGESTGDGQQHLVLGGFASFLDDATRAVNDEWSSCHIPGSALQWW
ncbi:hypothetical protein SDC9_195979 [bioreactor metagenome]|uniref:Uncharacterized protein n=1 Tax=bioreactor metagenome TaxID=1076179 RepID=A0A645IC10_9ZZZZ